MDLSANIDIADVSFAQIICVASVRKSLTFKTAQNVAYCREGKTCKFTHPTFNIPAFDPKLAGAPRTNPGILCHNCHERGHKASACPHLPAASALPQTAQSRAIGFYNELDKRRLSEVTCYKCGETGHFANRYVIFMTIIILLSHSLLQMHKRRTRLPLQQTKYANWRFGLVADCRWCHVATARGNKPVGRVDVTIVAILVIMTSLILIISCPIRCFMSSRSSCRRKARPNEAIRHDPTNPSRATTSRLWRQQVRLMSTSGQHLNIVFP